MRVFTLLFITIFLGYGLRTHAQHDDSISTYIKALYAAENYDKIVLESANYNLKSLNSTSCYYIGLAHFMQQKDSAALVYFSRSITLNPFFSDVYYYKGLSLTYMEQYQDAITHFRAALKLLPDEGDYFEALAEAYYFGYEPDSALRYLQLAATANAGRGDIYMKMADIFLEKEQKDKALEAYYQCLYKSAARTSAYHDCLYNIGYFEYENGRYEDAELALTTLLNSDPEDYQAIEKLIQVYFSTNNGKPIQGYRTKLYGAFWKNKLPDFMKESFCFDQFEWNGKKVMAYENFSEPREQLYYKHVFYISNAEGEEEYTIQTERNSAIEAVGKAYYIGQTKENKHLIFFDQQLDTNFTYSVLKKMVTSIMDGKLEATDVQEIPAE